MSLNPVSRRQMLAMAAAGTLVSGRNAAAQQAPQPVEAPPVTEYKPRSTVALVHGDDRYRNVQQALEAIDDQIRPRLKAKKHVVIKPNNVSDNVQLAATHADTLRAILDYLGPRYKGAVTIAESSHDDTWTGFRNFGYTKLPQEYKSLAIELVDFNEEGKFVKAGLIDGNMHLVPVRLAARLVDPDAFIICSTMLKTHNYVVATLSVKNMVMGSPLHQGPKETRPWSDKRLYHTGHHVSHYNMMMTAQTLRPYWGVALIDGYEGMEGDGPIAGTPVPSRVALASTDFLAADRVGLECMGVDPRFVGYLQYCGQVGLGNFDLAKIDIQGPAPASVQKKYHLHPAVERQLQWMAPGKVVVGG